jgi:two-component system, NarL family, invasion response regulator UvrY
MIKLLIVDDHMIFREGLKKVLTVAPDIEVVGETGDGTEALHMIGENAYDVVLLDLALPGMAGLDILRAAKAHNKNLSVLVLSIYPEELYAVTVLKEGASGYLTKESIPSDLIRAIRKAAQGRKYVSDALAERFAEGLTGRGDGLGHELLSEKEFRVFRMLASGKSVKEIAFALSLARTTVSTHRTRILVKMGMKTNADLTRYATEHHLLADQ